MFKNTNVTPVNWNSIVDETLRRRKFEKMTQREHAALAKVSVPTMAAFERGDKSLSLLKAFDILRVVGMVYEPSTENIQDIFVKESLNKWREINEKEPNDSPMRFPYGWYQFDYYLEGDLKFIETNELIRFFENKMKRYSGLPPFYSSEKTKHRIVKEDIIECRLNNFADFWRATPYGRLFFIRGHQEDFEETFPPQSVFDITIPIWRMAEALLHAEQLASFLKKKEESCIQIHFEAVFTGLNGRVLRPWSMPDIMSSFQFSGRNALTNEALLKAEIPAEGLSSNLSEHLYPLVSNLYQNFGIKEFSQDLINVVIKRLQQYKDIRYTQ